MTILILILIVTDNNDNTNININSNSNNKIVFLLYFIVFLHEFSYYFINFTNL